MSEKPSQGVFRGLFHIILSAEKSEKPIIFNQVILGWKFSAAPAIITGYIVFS